MLLFSRSGSAPPSLLLGRFLFEIDGHVPINFLRPRGDLRPAIVAQTRTRLFFEMHKYDRITPEWVRPLARVDMFQIKNHAQDGRLERV